MECRCIELQSELARLSDGAGFVQTIGRSVITLQIACARQSPGRRKGASSALGRQHCVPQSRPARGEAGCGAASPMDRLLPLPWQTSRWSEL